MTGSSLPPSFEAQWRDHLDDERVWAPGGDPGTLRFTPDHTAIAPRTGDGPPPAATPARAPAAAGRRRPAVLAAAVVVALLAAFVGASIGRNLVDSPLRPTLEAGPVPAAGLAPGASTLVPPATTPPTTAPAAGGTAPASPSTPQDSLPPNLNGVARGVADVTTTLAGSSGAAAGTGMVLTPTGEVLTNNHVIAGSSSVRVQIEGTGPTYAATVVGTDETDDIAVLQIQHASGLEVVQTGDSSGVAIGDPVTAVGNALGRGGAPAVVTGTIQALDQSITVTDDATGAGHRMTGLIQSNVALQPGDSGGPLLNSRGLVVGMDTAASAGRRFPGAQQGFAIPINQAMAVAAEIMAGHSSPTIQIGPPAFLGVQLPAPGAGSAPGNAAAAPGAAVEGVQPGSPAAKAGLAAGDRIVGLGGHAVDSADSLRSLLATHRPGDKVDIDWITGTKAGHASVQLAAGPPR